jgi:hypothetical protein
VVQYTSSPIGQTSPILFALWVLFGFREFQRSKADVISRNCQTLHKTNLSWGILSVISMDEFVIHSVRSPKLILYC